MKISQTVQSLLRCPACHAKLRGTELHYVCASAKCNSRYPVIDGVPVLVNEGASAFSIDEILSRKGALPEHDPMGAAARGMRRLIPRISRNVKGRANFDRMIDMLLQRSGHPRVLVIGGCTLGQGMQTIADNPSFELVESDISFGPRVMLICDAHEVPFEDEAFDGVIVQAVLEHVLDPYVCVGQIHRILNRDGLVYAETPFMQQVHGGKYDFARFTHSGHRRLFRYFEEIDSGAVCGPGMALAWAYQYFLLSFVTSATAARWIRLFARLTSFWLKYFDPYLIEKPGGIDAASAFYFLGRKGDRILPDRELIRHYRGQAGREVGWTRDGGTPE